jgi:glycosyltransferase involved in cell wall biosynthesis
LNDTLTPPVKIAHVITSLEVGGAERMLARLVAAQPRSIECHVICLRAEGPVAADLRNAGATVHALGMENGSLHGALSFGRIVRLLRELRPDVVQTWLYHADLFGGLAARLVGIDAVVWNVRSVELPETAGVLTRGIVRMCSLLSSRVPTRIVCCSELARCVHERRGYDAGRFVVIPNGVDLERFKPNPEARIAIRRECRVPEDAPLIGLIARLDPLKNHALFFAAAKILHETNPRAHFLLAGKGVHESTPAVRRWLREAGVEHVTRLLGQRSDIDRVLASLDVATCSSSSEAFPNALAEAMACAVPCVTTDVGDAPMIVGGTGHVVPVDDPDALANAWRTVLALPDHERQRRGEAARERVKARFEINAVTEQYLQLYASLAPVQADG